MKFRLVFLVLLIFTVHNVWTRDVRSVFGAIFEYKLPAIMSNEPEPEAENVQTSVPEDEDNPSVPFAISEKEFTALRIEYIKNQILKKLRLKEMPTSTIDDLPIPLKEDNFLPQADDNLIGSDDFYGKTTQAIIFPSEGN